MYLQYALARVAQGSIVESGVKAEEIGVLGLQRDPIGKHFIGIAHHFVPLTQLGIDLGEQGACHRLAQLAFVVGIQRRRIGEGFLQVLDDTAVSRVLRYGGGKIEGIDLLDIVRRDVGRLGQVERYIAEPAGEVENHHCTKDECFRFPLFTFLFAERRVGHLVDICNHHIGMRDVVQIAIPVACYIGIGGIECVRLHGHHLRPRSAGVGIVGACFAKKKVVQIPVLLVVAHIVVQFQVHRLDGSTVFVLDLAACGIGGGDGQFRGIGYRIYLQVATCGQYA